MNPALAVREKAGRREASEPNRERRRAEERDAIERKEIQWRIKWQEFKIFYITNRRQKIKEKKKKKKKEKEKDTKIGSRRRGDRKREERWSDAAIN